VKTAKVWSEGNNKTMEYCLAQDLPTLVWAANLAEFYVKNGAGAKVTIDDPRVSRLSAVLSRVQATDASEGCPR
jgi:hypothetical protein